MTDRIRNRKSKRLFAGFMVMMLLIGVFPAYVFAEDLELSLSEEAVSIEPGFVQEAQDEEVLGTSEDTDIEGVQEGDLQVGEEDTDETDVIVGTYFDVTDFGANGTDKKDDRDAINEALAMANQTDQTITVNIPDGNYYISKSLFIYSDTILKLGANTNIYETSDFGLGMMLTGVHLDSNGELCRCCVGDMPKDCTGRGYSKCHNITVDGGTWICYKNPKTGACPGDQIITFWHSQDITIRNMTCKNAPGHTINLSGVNNALVSNVKFENASQKKDYSKSQLFTNEFVHLDYCSEEGEPIRGYPTDNTPSKNITIENCTFNNGYAGLGNHHSLPNKNAEISSNITVRNCTFNKIKSYAIGEFSVKGLTVENCKATNGLMLAWIKDSSDIHLTGNTYDKGSKTYNSVVRDCSGIKVEGSDAISIDKNAVKNSVNAGISVTRSTNADITNNKCNKTTKEGIVVKSVKGGNIASNTIKNAKLDGIEYRSTTGMTISKNDVSSTKSALYMIGTKKDKSKATVLDNILNSKKEYDLYYGLNSNNSTFGGNVFKHNTVLFLSTKYKGTMDIPKLGKCKIPKKKYAFTGEKIMPPITVYNTAGQKLKRGVDYEIYYRKTRGPGTAWINVEGKTRSIYKGQTKKVTYQIIAPKE